MCDACNLQFDWIGYTPPDQRQSDKPEPKYLEASVEEAIQNFLNGKKKSDEL